jgi:hypothetical protein
MPFYLLLYLMVGRTVSRPGFYGRDNELLMAWPGTGV